MVSRLVVLAILALGTSVEAQGGIPPQAQDSARYARLRSRIEAGDTTADFTELRVLAAKMPSPSALGSSVKDHFALARETPDSLVARAHVDSVTWLYFGHVRAHIDAQRIFAERHDTVRSGAEAAIVRELLASIGTSDGLTTSTAISVVSIDEEYAYMTAHHVKPEMQALLDCGNGKCDSLTGVDSATGKSVTYYFRLTWK